MGVVSSLILVLYGFMSGDNEALFWSLFAFSAVIFLLPYLAMFLAFVKMRVVDADHLRPFAIPGNLAFARLLAYLCFAILTLSIILFIYTPNKGIEWPVLSGVVGMLLLGELVIFFSENQGRG